VPEGNGGAALGELRLRRALRAERQGEDGLHDGAPEVDRARTLGEPKTIDGVVFELTTSGFWVRVADLMVATPEPLPILGRTRSGSTST